MLHLPFGKTGLSIPPVVFGSTSLGNLFCSIPDQAKKDIVREWIRQVPAPIFIDSAGKYGAGLALEVIGRELREAGVEQKDVLISNKLAWRRIPLTTPEPTFEPGAWVEINHDAVQDISYDGMYRCYEEGNQLLGSYSPQLLSVHDPDEYLDAATSSHNRSQRLEDILQAYRALTELKQQGKTAAIGIGAKNWKAIHELDRYCQFDWVMFANSLTIMHHPRDLVDFLDQLHQRQVGVVNSALFHGGFLVGGEFFDYRRLDPTTPQDQWKLEWRERFHQVCRDFGLDPFHVGVAFGKSHPAIHAVALSSSRADRVRSHLEAFQTPIPDAFWAKLKDLQLIDRNYPYL